jgi:hypothetical protein
VQDTTKRDPRFDPYQTTHDGIKSAVEAGARAGESVAAGKVPGINDDEFTHQQVKKAKSAGAVVSSSEDLDERNAAIKRGDIKADAWDAGMSWGTGNGGTETTAERNSPTIPPAAQESMGISPQNVTQQSPMPVTLGKPVTPDPNRNQSMNTEAIFNFTNFGR